MFPYPIDEALILVLLLFISAFISDSDIPNKARVVVIPGFILAIVAWFVWQTQYYNVLLYNNVQACREETARQRYMAERCGFKLGVRRISSVGYYVSIVVLVTCFVEANSQVPIVAMTKREHTRVDRYMCPCSVCPPMYRFPPPPRVPGT